jgi:hypothetical protein
MLVGANLLGSIVVHRGACWRKKACFAETGAGKCGAMILLRIHEISDYSTHKMRSLMIAPETETETETEMAEAQGQGGPAARVAGWRGTEATLPAGW